MTHRFYVLPEFITNGCVRFTEDQSRQIRNVLRLRSKDGVAVFDGSGREYDVTLEQLDTPAIGRVVGTSEPNTEPEVCLTLVQGLPKGEKIELILQKCTEIGVSRFAIVETARSVPRIPPDRLRGRLERWRAIVKEAAEQSGRVKIPSLEGIHFLRTAFKECRGKGIIAWESEKEKYVTSELTGTSEITLFIGPEGGFTAEEIAAAAKSGITPVSLGPRILRTETAAIVASTLILNE